MGPDGSMGGVYNHINFNLYHYARNNPVKYLDPDGRFDYSYNDKNDIYWNGNYVCTIEKNVMGTSNTYSLDHLIDTIADIQMMHSKEMINSKNMYDKFKNYHSDSSLFFSIIEPIKSFTGQKIAGAYLDIFFEAYDLDKKISGGNDPIQDGLHMIWAYCSNVEDAYSIYENNPDMRRYNTVTVEDLFQIYSSGEELSHRYNKTISIKTKIINIRTGEIINRFELEKTNLFNKREVEYELYSE